jgi:glucose/mannose-6-phosphate isomerase
MNEGFESTMSQLRSFVDDLDVALSLKIENEIECKNIILCGMGGSAISGDVVADCCYSKSKKYIRVIKYPVLPEWVDSDTLAIVSSYSGNTKETLDMYDNASKVGCKIVVVTSGGTLNELAEKNGDTLIRLPSGMHPRHAIGFMIGYSLMILKSAGCADLESDIREILPGLREYRKTMDIKNENGIAWKMAELYLDKVPIICSDASIKSVIFRWKTQINENAKRVAFCSSISEMAHCLNPWLTSKHSNYSFTILQGVVDSPHGIVDITSKTLKTLDEYKVEYSLIQLGGRNTLDTMFRAIILGDYISVYMAEMRGIDPATVIPIIQLKEKLKKHFES